MRLRFLRFLLVLPERLRDRLRDRLRERLFERLFERLRERPREPLRERFALLSTDRGGKNLPLSCRDSSDLAGDVGILFIREAEKNFQ